MSRSETETSDIVALQRTLYESKNATRRWLHTSRRDIVSKAVREAPVNASNRALEVGPGSGVYLPTLCQNFQSVTAIDIEAKHIRALSGFEETHDNINFVVADLCAHHWDEKFDLVLCSEVIEHVANPKHFLGGLADATRSGGILILSTPQPWSLLELTASIALSWPLINVAKAIYREPVLPTGHISVMRASELTDLLRSHGFEILNSQYFGLYMPLIAEFGGSWGMSQLKRLEQTVQSSGATGLLWTQLHVARKC